MFTEQRLIQDYMDLSVQTENAVIFIRCYFYSNLFCSNFGECIKFNLN